MSLPLSLKQIKEFLAEDARGGDVTTNCIPILKKASYSFVFISKEQDDFILCASRALEEVLKSISKHPFSIKYHKKDGDTVKNKEIILEGSANAADFLLAERVALNLMQQLSAVSTNVFNFKKLLKNTNIEVLDTRKTVPGLRLLQKYAVKCGGGKNHRIGLYDMIMVKDNHIAAAGGIKNAIECVIKNNKKRLKVEVECENLDQVKIACKYNIDVIMLDNMKISNIKKACVIIAKLNPKIQIEVSGGINFKNVKKYKDLNINFISCGFFTHSVKSIDISAKIL